MLQSPSDEGAIADGKKPRYEETASTLLSDHLMQVRQMSAFQPWAPSPSMKVLAKLVEARDG